MSLVPAVFVICISVMSGVRISQQQDCPDTAPFFLGSPRNPPSPADQVIQKICPLFQSSYDLALGAMAGVASNVNYDPVYDMVYWGIPDEYTVHRAIHDERYTNTDFCFSEQIIEGADIIDIDIVNRKLYWGCICSGVGVANLDGSEKLVLYSGVGACGADGVGGNLVTDIRIDATNQFIYWGSGEGRLSKGLARVDSSCVDLRSRELVECIELNIQDNEIYWISRTSGFQSPSLLRCGDTRAPGGRCGNRIDDEFITIPDAKIAYDMILYESNFYVTVVSDTLKLKVIRVSAELGATPDITFVPSQSYGYLFAQPAIAEGDIMPTEIFLDVDGYEGLEGIPVTIVISRSGNLFRCTSITVTTIQSGTAKPVEDYTETTMDLELTFTPKMPTVSMDIALPDNNLLEGDQTFTISLSNPIQGTLGVSTATVTINDNESGFRIATQDGSVFDESDGHITITVERNTYNDVDAYGVLTIQSSTSGAALSSDLADTSMDIHFLAGSDSVNIRFPLVDDNIWEESETFQVTLSLTNGCCIISPLTIDIVIQDNDDYVEISEPANSESITVLESSEKAIVTLFRFGNKNNDINVLISTVDSSATSGSDYVSRQDDMVTIPAGESSFDVEIPIMDDQVRESPLEYFEVVLSSLSSEEIGARDRIRVYIQDDEVEFRMKETFIEVQESVGTVSIPVTRLGYELTSGSVDVKIDDSSASIAILETPTVQFESGDTEAMAEVTLLDDALVEGPRMVVLTLVGADGGSIGSPNTAVTSVKDDDSSFAFLQEEYPVLETDNTVTVTVLRRGCVECESVVDYQTADLTASGGEDFVAKSGSIVFNPGQTTDDIEVQIIDDSDFEGDESFFVQLMASSGIAGTRVTIQDNEEEPTTPRVVDVCDEVICYNDEICYADPLINRGICVCRNFLIGGSCEEQPIENPALTLAEILGLSLGIVIGTSVFVIAMAMCLLAVSRASMAGAPQPTSYPLQSLRLNSAGMPQVPMTAPYSTYSQQNAYFGPN